MLREAEHLGDDGLHFGRVLRRRVNDHLALLAGIGDRGLRFEIELLLAQVVEHALEPMRGRLRWRPPRRRGQFAGPGR